MNRSNLELSKRFAAQSIEWAALILLVLLSLPPILFRHQSLTAVSRLNLVDGSWLLDTTYKAAAGIWFGRDVAFTFGPLYQWLSSAPSRWIGLSTGTIYATYFTLPFCALILASFCTVRLLLPNSAPWRRTLLFLLAVVFWSPPDFRAALCLLAFAVFLSMTDPPSVTMRAVLPRAVAAAGISVTAFLVSADTGVYCVAALLLVIFARSLGERPRDQLVKELLVAAISFALLVLLTNAIMSSWLDLTFWRSSLSIANGYRWFEPLRMAKADKRLVLETVALGIIVFGVAWFQRKSDGPWTRRPAFLLSAFCLAFLLLQTSLVRSDPGHIAMGIYPMIFFCGAIALDQLQPTGALSIILPIATLAVTLVFAHQSAMFVPAGIAARARQIAHPVLACPAGFQEFYRACFPAQDAQLLTAVSTYLRSSTTPTEQIAVFPYETAFGLASRRQVAGGVLQSYLVNGPYLSSLELDGLQRAAPPFALYLPDGIISVPLDSVPNFTRSAELWFYFLRHYRAERSPVFGVVGLVRDESRSARLTLDDETIANPMPPVSITKRSTVLTLGPIQWPSSGADFLRLRLRLDYPAWWRVRKPSCLTLQMSFADSSEKSIQFVVEPNRSTDVWVYPWDDRDMADYFQPGEADWPRRQRPALANINLLITPFDWISVVPRSVTVESVEAVRLSMK